MRFFCNLSSFLHVLNLSGSFRVLDIPPHPYLHFSWFIFLAIVKKRICEWSPALFITVFRNSGCPAELTVWHLQYIGSASDLLSYIISRNETWLQIFLRSSVSNSDEQRGIMVPLENIHHSRRWLVETYSRLFIVISTSAMQRLRWTLLMC